MTPSAKSSPFTVTAQSASVTARLEVKLRELRRASDLPGTYHPATVIAGQRVVCKMFTGANSKVDGPDHEKFWLLGRLFCLVSFSGAQLSFRLSSSAQIFTGSSKTPKMDFEPQILPLSLLSNDHELLDLLRARAVLKTPLKPRGSSSASGSSKAKAAKQSYSKPVASSPSLPIPSSPSSVDGARARLKNTLGRFSYEQNAEDDLEITAFHATSRQSPTPNDDEVEFIDAESSLIGISDDDEVEFIESDSTDDVIPASTGFDSDEVEQLLIAKTPQAAGPVVSVTVIAWTEVNLLFLF